MYKFGNSSKEKLETVHEDLQTIMYKAIELSSIDFGITEGMRSLERAEQLQKEGASKLGTRSKHCVGKAVDIVCYNGGKVTWELDYYEIVAGVVGEVSELADIPIRWGGSWKTGVFVLNREMKFIDAVHFELGD